MKEMYQMAVELLEKYERAEVALIWDYSSDIRAAEYRLEDEVARYRYKLERAYNEAKIKV